MIALAFKEKEKYGRTLGTPSSDANHMSEPCSRARPSLHAVGVRAVTAQENLWWHQLSEVSVVPGYPQSTGRRVAVKAVTDTRNWSLNCVIFSVGGMVMDWLLAIKRRHRHKSYWARYHGNSVVGQFPTVFLCEFVKLTCCLQQIIRRTLCAKSIEKRLWGRTASAKDKPSQHDCIDARHAVI